MGEEVDCVLESPLPDYARPVGLAKLGSNSHFARPYRIRSPHRIHIGDDVWFGPGGNLSVVEVLNGAEYDPVLRVGDRCAVGAGLMISCIGGIEIGDDVAMGPNVYVGDAFREYGDAQSMPYDLEFAEPKSIRIENGAMLGFGAVVLPGVTIGERAIVSANAVVARDVPAHSVVFGNPARVIRAWDEKAGRWAVGPAR